MNEMVERVARVLHDATDELSEGDIEAYVPLARVVLEAMSQPTVEMASAGMHRLSELPDEAGWGTLAIEAQHIWLAMLNAALCDSGSGPQGRDDSSSARGEAPQSGDAEGGASPKEPSS